MELSAPPTKATVANYAAFELDDDEFSAEVQTKNTFVHYSLPQDAPPVNTAPGHHDYVPAGFPRVFKTKPTLEDKPSDDAAEEAQGSSEVATADEVAGDAADAANSAAADAAAGADEGAVVESIEATVTVASADAAGDAGVEQQKSFDDAGERSAAVDAAEVETVQPGPIRPKAPSASMGSGLHDSGGCSPCAWYWKPEGCSKGPSCTRCHLCPPGELKRRKKAKAAGNPVVSIASMDPRYAPDPPRPPAYSEPAYVVTQDAPAPWDSQASVDILPTKVPLGTLGELRVKNTFIEVDTPPASPCMGAGPPTASAPGQMLSRLFRTTGATAPSLPHVKRTNPVSSSTSITEEAGVASSGIAASAGAAGADAGTASDNAVAQGSEANRISKEELHQRRECTPCNYFWYKADGCRQGNNCEFCHLCPKGEIKRRKKEKVKMLKAAGQALPNGLEINSSVIAAN